MNVPKQIQFHENLLYTALNLVDLPKCEEDINFNAKIILAGITGMLYAAGNHDIAEALANRIGIPAYTPTDIKSQYQPRYCNQCQYFGRNEKKPPTCLHDKTKVVDLVFGPYTIDCFAARQKNSQCGAEGKLFVAAINSVSDIA